jgi:hypothetical protein
LKKQEKEKNTMNTIKNDSWNEIIEIAKTPEIKGKLLAYEYFNPAVRQAVELWLTNKPQINVMKIEREN